MKFGHTYDLQDGGTALVYACGKQKLDMAALLLERGTDITVDPFVSSPPTSCMCTCMLYLVVIIMTFYTDVLVNTGDGLHT